MASYTINKIVLPNGDEVSLRDTSKLPKKTYEWNKAISFGGSGFLKIGSFPMYDTNVTIDIDATTSKTYHGTVVIATQNVSASSMGSAHKIQVYGDPTGVIASSLRIVWTSGSRNYNIYFIPQSWSKNFIHISALGNYMDGATDICISQTGTAPTTTSGLEPENILSGMTVAEIEAGTSTANRLISPANLKTAIDTWAAVSEEDLNGMYLSSALTMNLNITNSLFVYNQKSADSLKQFIPGYADPPYYGETHAVNGLYDTSPAARYIKVLPDNLGQDMEFIFSWLGKTNSDSCLVQFLTDSNEVIASCTMENRDYNTFSSKLTFSQYPTKIRVYYTSTDITATGNVEAYNLALIPYAAYDRLRNSEVPLTHVMFSLPFSSEIAAYITGTSIDPLRSSLSNGIKRDGSHNRLQCTATSRTHNGVAFTVNSDGTITANGTASGNAYIIVGAVPTTGGLFDGHHRLCGCPVGGSNTKYALYAASGNYSRYDYGQSILLTPTTVTGNMSVVAMVYSGTTVDNLVFKPMICHESDYAILGINSYTQYAPTNRELYEMILNLQST